MDHMLMGVYSRSFIGDYSYRCNRCGQGPVTASDGFLMAHCLNCGTYHAPAWDPIDIDLGIGSLLREGKDWVVSWIKGFGKRLSRNAKSATSEPCDGAACGGVQ